MMFLFMALDQTSHQVQRCVLFRAAMLALIHQPYDFGQQALVLFAGRDYARQDFRQ